MTGGARSAMSIIAPSIFFCARQVHLVLQGLLDSMPRGPSRPIGEVMTSG